MKRSELKEAIKSEIKSVLSENRYDINDPNSPLGRLNDEYESSGLKGIVDKYGLDVVLMMLSSGEYGDRLNESVLSEQSNNPDFDKKVASFAKKINNEMDYPGGVLEAMKQIKSRLERIISKVEDAKRGGAEEEPLMKMIGLKEAMFNEEAVLEDVMIAIDFHLDGEIDYDEMSKRVEDLILGKIKPDFKVMNEGTWSVGTKEQIGNFIKDMGKIKTHYYDIVGDDEVYNGLDSAVSRAEEMMGMVAENKSDIREEDEGPSKKEVEAEKSIAKQKDIELSKQQRKKEVADFMKKMQDKGIVGKDKKVLDSAKYKEEFAKFKADLKK